MENNTINTKIADMSGNPFVCVHQTQNAFDEFDDEHMGSGNFGPGHYFCIEANYWDGFGVGGLENKNCYLIMQNPYDNSKKVSMKDVIKLAKMEDYVKELQANGGRINLNYKDTLRRVIDELFFTNLSYVVGLGINTNDDEMFAWKDQVWGKVVDGLKEQGYDGLVEKTLLSKGVIVVAWYSNSICQIPAKPKVTESNFKSYTQMKDVIGKAMGLMKGYLEAELNKLPIMENVRYYDDVETLENPSYNEFKHFMKPRKWYRMVIDDAENKVFVWDANTSLLHQEMDDIHNLKESLHLFIHNGKPYLQDYDLDDYNLSNKEEFYVIAKSYDESQLFKKYFPNYSIVNDLKKAFENDGKYITESIVPKRFNNLVESFKKVSNDSYVMEITSYNDIKPFIQRYCSFGARGLLNTNNNKVYLADVMTLTHGDMVDDLIKNGEQIDYDSIIRFMVYPTYETAIDSEYGEYWNNNEDNRIDFLTNKDLYVLFKQYSFMNDRLNKILKLDTMEDVEKDENVELISEAVNQHSLYHGCDLAYAVSMMIDNTMRGETIANINGKKYQGNSLTRSLQFAKDWQEDRWDGHGDELNQFWVVLELNKERLKTKYKVLPYNYWEDYFGKDYEHTIDRNGYGDQYEEFVVGRISNLRNYLDDVYLSPECFNVEYAEIFAIVKRELELRGENCSDSDIDKALQTLGINKPSPNDFDGEYLNESIAYAEMNDDEMMVILHNPTRKELKDNDLDDECRLVYDGNNGYYFASSVWTHEQIEQKLQAKNLPYAETSGEFYYYQDNLFATRDDWSSEEEYQEYKNDWYQSLKSMPYIVKNFGNFKVEIFQDEYLNEEINEVLKLAGVDLYESAKLNDNFWKWFGDSKMKNKKGEPIPFYHTTYSDISVFEPVVYNKGKFTPSDKGVDHFHFSKYKEWTDNFAKDEFSRSGYKNRKTYEVYLKIENPLVILPIEKTINDWVKYLNSKGINISLEELLHMSTFGNDFDDVKNYRLPKGLKKEEKDKWLKNAIEQEKQWYASKKCQFWKVIRNSNKVLSSYCKEAGFDGILMRDTNRNNAKNLTVIVFDSNQIKSINNNGNWSEDSNNINESWL